MALPNLPIPLYPDVPNLPGVPALLRAQNVAVDTIVKLAGDAKALGLDLLPKKQWGIFDKNGKPIAVADSVLSVDFQQEYRVSNYPQEAGAFASYNKVQTPFEPRVTMTKGGTEAQRSQFLKAITVAVASLDFFSVVTPEITYPSVTLTRQDYSRTQTNGATLLTVNVWLEQIRVTGTQTFTQTAAPNGADTVNTGPVQPLPAADDIDLYFLNHPSGS